MTEDKTEPNATDRSSKDTPEQAAPQSQEREGGDAGTPATHPSAGRRPLFGH